MIIKAFFTVYFHVTIIGGITKEFYKRNLLFYFVFEPKAFILGLG